MPVLITGVILLNPRVIEYDFAPLTLFLALILFRTIASFAGTKRAIVFSFLFFGAINAAVLLVAPIDTNYTYLNYIQGFVLIGIAAAGFWNLLRQTRGAIPNRISPAAVPSAIDSGA